MVNPVLVKKYESADEFINFLLYEYEGTDLLEGANGSTYIYRGERTASQEFKLLPSILRENNKVIYMPLSGDDREKWLTEVNGNGYVWAEFMTLYRFHTAANNHGLRLPEISIFDDYEITYNKGKFFQDLKIWIPDELLEIAGIAQHYGVPTRLLDWTFNPFTALYFAAMGAVEKFYTDMLTKKNSNENDIDPYHYNKEDMIVIWALRNNLSDQQKYGLNLKFIKPPYSRNPNLAAQQGVFTHEQQELPVAKNIIFPVVNKTPLDQKLKPDSSNRPLLFKHMIPIYESNRALRLLVTLNHTASKIFPGYSGVAREVIDQKKRVFIGEFWHF